MRRHWGSAVAVAALVACQGGEAWTPVKQRDTVDDPQQVRPNYGNAKTHTWWPLAEPEVAALEHVDQARSGEMYSLLAFALVASGDHSDSASYASAQERIEKFIAELKPTMDAADDWHKGYELNRAMHRVFFNAEKTDLAGYELNQAHLTGIFETGKYNCISSALLYAVLARGFSIPVRGVLVPTHAFIEIGEPGKKILEVETTSNTGFDWVHDERFYKEGAANWSSSRGLRPVTLDDYQHREILPPHRLVAHAMLDARAGNGDADRSRLSELAAVLAPEDPEAQKFALGSYINEANDLYEKKAWRTIVKLFDTVGPNLGKLSVPTSDTETAQRMCWVHYYHAQALVIVARPADAITTMDEGLKCLDPKFPDYEKLHKNLLWVLMDQLLEMMHEKNYAAAIELIRPRFALCKADTQCAENLGIIYQNQAVKHENNGDWRAARAALQECVKLLPDVKLCSDELRDLESRHAR